MHPAHYLSCRQNNMYFFFRYRIGTSISVRAVTSLLWTRAPMNSRNRIFTSSTAFSEMSISTSLSKTFYEVII